MKFLYFPCIFTLLISGLFSLPSLAQSREWPLTVRAMVAAELIDGDTLPMVGESFFEGHSMICFQFRHADRLEQWDTWLRRVSTFLNLFLIPRRDSPDCWAYGISNSKEPTYQLSSTPFVRLRTVSVYGPDSSQMPSDWNAQNRLDLLLSILPIEAQGKVFAQDSIMVIFHPTARWYHLPSDYLTKLVYTLLHFVGHEAIRVITLVTFENGGQTTELSFSDAGMRVYWQTVNNWMNDRLNLPTPVVLDRLVDYLHPRFDLHQLLALWLF